MGARTPSVFPQVMRLRRAVLKIPPKSSVPPGLPIYKIPSVPTHSKSTLPQLLIPLHFNSRRCNTYKKPGGGTPSYGPKVWQLVTNPASPCISASLHPCFVTSPPHASHPGARTPSTDQGARVTSPLPCTRTNPCNPFPLMELLHDSRTPPGWGYALPANQVKNIEEQLTRPPRKLRRQSLFCKQMCGHLAQIPHQPAPGHHLQRVIRHINLPPVKTLPRRGHKVVVIVVPAFAERQHRQQPVVPARVARFVAPGPKQMRKRVDRECVVPNQHGAQAKSPNKQRPSAN